MYSAKHAGFSAARIIIITLIILGVVVAVLTVAYFLLKEQRTTSAQSFTNTVITDISNGDVAKTFSELDSSLKTDESTAYYSWLFWSLEFGEKKITIDSQATDTTYDNATLDHLFGDESIVTVTYTTSGSSRVSLTAIQRAEGWKILNYASI